MSAEQAMKRYNQCYTTTTYTVIRQRLTDFHRLSPPTTTQIMNIVTDSALGVLGHPAHQRNYIARLATILLRNNIHDGQTISAILTHMANFDATQTDPIFELHAWIQTYQQTHSLYDQIVLTGQHSSIIHDWRMGVATELLHAVQGLLFATLEVMKDNTQHASYVGSKISQAQQDIHHALQTLAWWIPEFHRYLLTPELQVGNCDLQGRHVLALLTAADIQQLSDIPLNGDPMQIKAIAQELNELIDLETLLNRLSAQQS